ncbi:MAG: substrate-binding domain-containing protein [Nocardioidaceae bacterium]
MVFVGGDMDSSSGRERLTWFRHWFGDEPLTLLGSFDVAWGQRAADMLLPDGMTTGTVVAAADVIALGLLNRLQTRGFRVPEDFRVIGFDGIGVSYLARPTLSTVRQPVGQMSEQILDLVVAGTASSPWPHPSPRPNDPSRPRPRRIESATRPRRHRRRAPPLAGMTPASTRSVRRRRLEG